MKITFNGRFLTAPQTGVQRVAGNLIRGVDKLIAAGCVRSNRSFEVQSPRGTQIDLSLSNVGLSKESVLTGQAWEQLELPVSRRRGALINLCNAGPLMGPSALTMIHDAQVFLTPSSYSKPFVAWYHFSIPRLARRARYLLTVSEYSKAQLVHFGVADPDKIIVIYNGVDHMLANTTDSSIVSRLGLLAQRYVFAFGNMQSHKNLDFLLRLFQDQRLRHVKLVVVGAVDWPMLGKTFGAQQQENVLLTGRLSDGEIRGLLEHAVCLTLPSSTEGFGLPSLEAMLVGCPAIVAPLAALPEICGAAALYAPLGDIDAWAAAILAMLEDDHARAERSLAGRAHAQTFTWQKSAANLLSALDKALS